MAEIETLHGIHMSERDVTIVVTSNGCTEKDHFVAVITKSEPPEVTFIRLTPDHCKAASRPYPIKFSMEEIGAKEFTVSNPFDPAPRW